MPKTKFYVKIISNNIINCHLNTKIMIKIILYFYHSSPIKLEDIDVLPQLNIV
jgi:hypothetical protein